MTQAHASMSFNSDSDSSTYALSNEPVISLFNYNAIVVNIDG